MTPTHKTGPLAEHPLRAPVLWGAAWGSSQAAAPLGFWWLDPGWPAPEDPRGDDAELDGRSVICDWLVDEAGWLRQCAGRLTHLHAREYPPAVNLCPDGDYPGLPLQATEPATHARPERLHRAVQHSPGNGPHATSPYGSRDPRLWAVAAAHSKTF